MPMNVNSYFIKTASLIFLKPNGGQNLRFQFSGSCMDVSVGKSYADECGICVRFPFLMAVLKVTERVSGINLFPPNTTVLNQN